MELELELDLERIKKLSEEREEDNWEFRSFLKQQSARRLDTLVHRLHKQISEEIDCTTCGNCCREISPGLMRDDVRRLAKGMALSVEEVEKRYLEPGDEKGESTIKETPCPFLKDDQCMVYPHRPNACKSYPHLHKKDFVFRLSGVIGNCSICPIAFNVYEYLKEELHEEYMDFKDIEAQNDW